jgi:hypothetical protein
MSGLLIFLVCLVSVVLIIALIYAIESNLIVKLFFKLRDPKSTVNGLEIGYCRKIHRSYSTETIFRGVSSINDLIKLYINHKIKMFVVTSNWKGKAFPVIDCDSEEDMLKCACWLDENRLECVLYQSSPGHYWLIVDCWCPVSEALQIAYNAPGIDEDYVKCCLEFKKFAVRVGYKNGFIPHIIKDQDFGNISQELKDFVEAFNNLIEENDKILKFHSRQEHYKDNGIKDDPTLGSEKLDYTIVDAVKNNV